MWFFYIYFLQLEIREFLFSNFTRHIFIHLLIYLQVMLTDRIYDYVD